MSDQKLAQKSLEENLLNKVRLTPALEGLASAGIVLRTKDDELLEGVGFDSRCYHLTPHHLNFKLQIEYHAKLDPNHKLLALIPNGTDIYVYLKNFRGIIVHTETWPRCERGFYMVVATSEYSNALKGLGLIRPSPKGIVETI